MNPAPEGAPVTGPEVVFPAGVGPILSGPGQFARPSIPRPMVLVALFYLAGLTMGRLLLLPVWALAPGAAAGLGVVAWGLLTRRTHPFRAPSAGIPLWLALVLSGWLVSNHVVRVDGMATSLGQRISHSELARVEGRVSRAERWGSAGLRLVLEQPLVHTAGPDGETFRLPLAAILEIPGPGFDASPSGEDLRRQSEGLIRLPGSTLRTWARPRPMAAASHPWAFDLAAFYRHQGIGARFEVPDLSLLDERVPSPRPRQTLNRTVSLARTRIRQALASRLAPDSAALASAVALGDRDGLSPEVKDLFRDSGLMHLLVVSGLHTAFMLGVALMLTRWTGAPPWTWAPVGLLTLLLYTALVGFYPPVVRASIMGAFLLGAAALGRRTSTLAALATSAFVTLLVDARNLLRPDWQLSYACVLSLAVLSPPLASLARSLLRLAEDGRISPGRGERARYVLYRGLLLPACTVLAILMGLLPLQVYYFGRLNLSAIVSNLVAIPLVNGVMLGAYVLALLEGLPGIAPLLGNVMELMIGLLLTLTDRFAASGPLHLGIAAAHPAGVAGTILFILTGPQLRRGEGRLGRMSRRQHSHLLLRVGIFFLLLAWAPLAVAPPSRSLLDLYLLDVGQGDAIVLRTRGNRVGVVDAGGGTGGGQGARTVVPFLRGLGVHRLAFAAASHADADHIGGLDAVIDAFRPPLLLVGPHVAATEAWNEVVRSARERGVRLQEVAAGQVLRGFGETRIDFLGPWPGRHGNDASVVMLVRHGDVEILLTGDIERGTEELMLRHGAAVDIDVIKVAHHGSRTSTTDAFLQAFDPEIALISAGRGNRFGHPAPDVLARLQARGILVARTDQHGTIRLRTDGTRLWIDRFAAAPP